MRDTSDIEYFRATSKSLATDVDVSFSIFTFSDNTIGLPAFLPVWFFIYSFTIAWRPAAFI